MKIVENLARGKHRDDIWFSAEEMHSFRYQAGVLTTRLSALARASRAFSDLSARREHNSAKRQL